MGQNQSLLKKKYIALIGDSTLDNIVWIKKGEKTIKENLQDQLRRCNIFNLAADGFTSQNVLEGGSPLVSLSIREQQNDPFQLTQNNLFNPLEQLKKIPNLTHLVLSIGGNDLRLIMQTFDKLEDTINQLEQNYKKIIDKVYQINPQCKITIMMQYKVCMYQDDFKIYENFQKIPGEGTGEEKVNKILERVYNGGILNLAQKHKIPVIDLAHSFDIYDEELYQCQIEPSAKGGELIANLITFVIKKHNFEGNSLMYFYKNNTIQNIPNNFNDKNLWKI